MDLSHQEGPSLILSQQSTASICSTDVTMHLLKMTVSTKFKHVHKSPHPAPNFKIRKRTNMIITFCFFKTNINCFSFIFMGTIIIYSMRKMLWQLCLSVRQFKTEHEKVLFYRKICLFYEHYNRKQPVCNEYLFC